MRLADGQLLLQLADADSRRAGGEGASQIGIVRGGRLQLLLAGRNTEVLLDSCSQVVLPWQPPVEGRAADLQLKMKELSDLKERAVSLNKEVQGITAQEELSRLKDRLKEIAEKIEALVVPFEGELKKEVERILETNEALDKHLALEHALKKMEYERYSCR